MNDILQKYIYGGIRIYYAKINDVFKATKVAQGISDNYLGFTELLACVLVATCKDEKASIAVSLKVPNVGKNFAAIAEHDGRVRGFEDEYTKGVINDGVILEVTQRLALRGDYKSVVCAQTISLAVDEYFKTSRQTESKCILGTDNDEFYCLFIEQFPITNAEHEIYRDSAKTEFEYLEKLAKGDFSAEKLLEKYNKVQELPLKYGCTCTKRSVREILSSLSEADLKKSADESGKVEIKCKYCGKVYIEHVFN